MDSILSVPQAKQQRQLVVTKTGEPYQPIRVYFQVSNYKTLLRTLGKLQCVELEDWNHRWVWLYDHEARKLRFDISYKDIDKADRPIILAEMTFPSEAEMYFDSRSIDRALYGLEFFNKRINWRVAKATRLRIVNHFFSAEQVKQQPLHEYYGNFFNRPDVKVPNPEVFASQLAEIEATHEDSDERMAAIDAFFEQEARLPLAEVEELTLDIHEIGMMPITMALKMRQIEAFERWNGNTSINQLEIMKQFMEWDELKNGGDENEGTDHQQP